MHVGLGACLRPILLLLGLRRRHRGRRPPGVAGLDQGERVRRQSAPDPSGVGQRLSGNRWRWIAMVLRLACAGAAACGASAGREQSEACQGEHDAARRQARPWPATHAARASSRRTRGTAGRTQLFRMDHRLLSPRVGDRIRIGRPALTVRVSCRWIHPPDAGDDRRRVL